MGMKDDMEIIRLKSEVAYCAKVMKEKQIGDQKLLNKLLNDSKISKSRAERVGLIWKLN